MAGGTGGAWGGPELTPDNLSGPFAGAGAGGGDSSGTGQTGSDATATTGSVWRMRIRPSTRYKQRRLWWIWCRRS